MDWGLDYGRCGLRIDLDFDALLALSLYAILLVVAGLYVFLPGLALANIFFFNWKSASRRQQLGYFRVVITNNTCLC